MVTQREVGGDTQSFGKALRSVLRQDPDIVLVGELRDHETIEAALTLAETGHLTFGTLHTSDASRRSTASSTSSRRTSSSRSARSSRSRSRPSSASSSCRWQTGRGRALAAEIMLATPAIRALIREGKSHQIYSQIQTGGRLGMTTMAAVAVELVRSRRSTSSRPSARCQRSVSELQNLIRAA